LHIKSIAITTIVVEGYITLKLYWEKFNGILYVVGSQKKIRILEVSSLRTTFDDKPLISAIIPLYLLIIIVSQIGAYNHLLLHNF